MLQIKPNNADFRKWHSNALRSVGRSEEAISSYDRGLELEANDFDILYQRAYSLMKLGSYEEAIDYFDKALEINPYYASVYYCKACIYALQSKVESSLKNLRDAIEWESEIYRELAKTDADFDGIRGDARFQQLLLGLGRVS